MSPSLPPEILDLIIGHLDDKPTFNACCLVSKSWVPRARRHLFAHIEFTPWGSSVRLWMEAFPVPSTSPTHYTRSLWLTQFDMADAVSLGAFTWIHQFRNIVELRVRGTTENGPTPVSLAPLHGLSPTLKLLHLFRLSAKLSELLNLICSFPLLEDLWLHFVTTKDAINTWNTLSTLPRLTGKLSLLAARQINPLIHGLLAIPSGPHFTKIVAAYPAGGSQPTNELISRCSDTLESLTVIHNASTEVPPPPDLSRTKKLKWVEFRWVRRNIQWIVTALRTANTTELRRITVAINPSVSFDDAVGETTRREWEDLDHLLDQLWISSSVVPEIIFEKTERRNVLVGIMVCLLPKLASKGAVKSWGGQQSER